MNGLICSKIWSNLGYKYSDLRIDFFKRSESNQPIFYDSSRHQYNVNIYVGWHEVAKSMQKIFEKRMPKYLKDTQVRSLILFYGFMMLNIHALNV